LRLFSIVELVMFRLLTVTQHHCVPKLTIQWCRRKVILSLHT